MTAAAVLLFAAGVLIDLAVLRIMYRRTRSAIRHRRSRGGVVGTDRRLRRG